MDSLSAIHVTTEYLNNKLTIIKDINNTDELRNHERQVDGFIEAMLKFTDVPELVIDELKNGFYIVYKDRVAHTTSRDSKMVALHIDLIGKAGKLDSEAALELWREDADDHNRALESNGCLDTYGRAIIMYALQRAYIRKLIELRRQSK